MSRRAAEEKINAGRVTVNGQRISLGTKADPETDDIRVDGRRVKPAEKKYYIMLNKPKGYVTTMHDEQDRRRVSELVRIPGARVYPVGRLDMFSEGLLIMTNDGEFANMLMHPSFDIVKTYHVHVKGDDVFRRIDIMRQPIVIDGYTTTKADISLIKETDDGAIISISIHEGRNRQVRRLAEKAGLKVAMLKRVSEGPLKLGNLETGKFRSLTQNEIDSVKRLFSDR